MGALRLFAAVAALAAPALLAGAATSAPLQAPAPGTALLEGGHVIYLRPGATRRGCLAARGRADARAVGAAFDRHTIPVGPVVAAPDCASREAARTAFGRVRTTASLASPRVLRLLLAGRPRGANTILVGPGRHLAAATRIALRPGEAGVFARGRLVVRVAARGWDRLFPGPPPPDPRFQEFAVPAGSAPHDVAPAPDGRVWYTAQNGAALGVLDPATGRTRHIDLGAGSSPHGVIVGPDGAPWITDTGLNAIVRVDPQTEAVQSFPLPANAANANLNTATFDGRGRLWFTGLNGWYGRLDPASGRMDVWPAPRGPGPYGMDACPDGNVYYASLVGHYVGRIDPESGAVTVLEPPTASQGARRVWCDSRSRVWVAEWNAGRLGLYDPATGSWREWRLPGANPQAYAVHVDERDIVWLTEFSNPALVRFDPATERFDVFRWPTAGAFVRQLLSRPGEVWGAESNTNKLVVFRDAR